MIYRCCDERRRIAVRAHGVLNGIDYVEVLDQEAPAGSPRQRTVLVRFVKAAPPLAAANFEIHGGDRVADVRILWATPAAAADPALVSPAEAAYLAALPDPEQLVALRTDSSGDHSAYRLSLVASAASLAPPPGIDPLLSRIAFSFKAECPTDFDCARVRDCPPDPEEAPLIDYLAKDYQSFRRLMLDRMAVTIPQWSERNAADLGVALVELLAYVGDRLSYAQDAVATEAYLGTARRRSSVRRHARLVDYFLHDGCNARVWVHLAVEGDPVTIGRGQAQFLTRVADAATVVPPPLSDRLLLQRPAVFEPLHDKTLFAELNVIAFHDWGDGECCLPAGATRATLRGDLANLTAGDVLVFEEVIGPRTGRAADADPDKRCAVRLVQVAAGLEDPLTDPPTPITEIRWADQDALPFALCLSARTGAAFGGRIVAPVSRALGNILLADHGLSVVDVPIGTVPEPHLHLVAAGGGERCDPPTPRAVPPRFRPALADAPLTQAGVYRHPPQSATAAMQQDPAAAAPAIALDASRAPTRWAVRRDLIGSAADDPHFVVEVEADGSARLRFGDDLNGRRPESGIAFAADYRIGSGPEGNIGADALRHVVTGIGGIVDVRNPLPAQGGTSPESMAHARVAAPQAFRVQERAVTEADWAEVTLRHPGVQRAAATFRWNGHGHTVFVTVDRIGGLAVTPDFAAALIAFLDRFRIAGYDLEIDGPRFVPLEIAMLVCVRRGYFRSEVKRAVLDELSDRRFAGGRSGLFHPDNFTFAQEVRLSAIVARAQSVEGVESVNLSLFRRFGQPDPAPLASGVLAIGRLEIARLANSPDFPERGTLTVTTGGGK